MKVREFALKDLEASTLLITELGYPISSIELRRRFEEMNKCQNGVFVAEDESGNVVGWIHLEARKSLVAGARAEIAALIVSPSAQRTGIGKLLIEKAEQWAREHLLKTLRVSSNLKRSESHPFYLKNGFVAKKESAIYAKEL